MSIRIITACSRPENLKQLYNSIHFDMIHSWYIIYDTSKSGCIKQFVGNPQVIELECNTKGVCGHPQINYAINLITEGYIYVLDDDNIMHPDFWKLVPKFNGEDIYTFDQIRQDTKKVLLGNKIEKGCIDTSQFIIPRKLVDNIRWPEQERCGDYAFISKIYANHPTRLLYVPGTYSYWNYLSKNLIPVTVKHTPPTTKRTPLTTYVPPFRR